MLAFERISRSQKDCVDFTPDNLIVAGWTGRDEKTVHHHIEELAAIGVPRPSSVPVFYRNSAGNVTQSTRIQVLGRHTSGEIEPVLVAMQDGLWVGVGSDHTDREAERMGIALSKQLCQKVMGLTLWRHDEVSAHWDNLVLRAHAVIGGGRVKYQEGTLAAIRTPADLIARAESAPMSPGTIMFCGTFAAIGGIRPASRFEMELEDPVLGRSLSHSYDVEVLPVVT
jgi:hypothetical protein